jgi:hypothetical protein
VTASPFDSSFARPTVVISRCIDFDSCRYDGQVIRAGSQAEKMVQPSTGRDLTERRTRFSRRYLAGVGEVDGFILKEPLSLEWRLTDLRLRDHFLTKLFALAGARRAASEGMGALIELHSRNKLLLMA